MYKLNSSYFFKFASILLPFREWILFFDNFLKAYIVQLYPQPFMLPSHSASLPYPHKGLFQFS